MTPVAGQDNDNVREATQKEWRRPELRKLPIEATSAPSPTKTTMNADRPGGPKQADAGGQIS
jgi:hypothetical protein